jgi:Protein of unknown function (DUF1553)/Protein of unknown function (DUF1549)/Planctomycete cytochrome C
MRHALTTIAFVLMSAAQAAGAPIDFVREVRPIFEHRCYSCHGEKKQKSGLRLDLKSAAFRGGELHGASIVPRNAKSSPLIEAVADETAETPMPPDGKRLTAAEIETLTRWVDEGAQWPEGVDRTRQVDRRDHWSFRPLATVAPPPVRDASWPRNGLDRFILARLEKETLAPAPEAERVTWLRRVSFDLIGLPPTPEQSATFASDTSPGAYDRVVDALLQSPRYGERWAQHWLDVVRYADTHGFEVNTERPNAWPYRDYAIQAFNRDSPYDAFIREQLVGDALGEDAATGFLVTASVLLPGQIGQDEPSKRLARQDALDEIVVSIGQTFLGLSIGCARCHDHKFDPISQRDYYALQAFVAGVEYEERELRTPEAEQKRVEEKAVETRLRAIDRQLAQIATLSHPGWKAKPSDAETKAAAVPPRPAVSARMNTDRFAPVNAQRLRFTIHATNNLEPCLDEVEIFDTTGANVALRSAGTTVRSSGDTVVADRHELRFINDGQYGNSRSWMSNAPGRGWVRFDFDRPRTIDRVLWARDREGTYNDRLATNYTIEVADAAGAWQTVADSTDRAPATGEPAPPFSLAGLTDDEARIAARLLDERRILDAKLQVTKDGRYVFAGKFRLPDTIRLLTRGDPEQPKDAIAPAVLGVLGITKLAGDTAEQTRRRVLAEWIASAGNPLTARVMVNRIWQGHFGVGLVETASDFGHGGLKPSHPELLDWLAAEFIRSGWSVKYMHRLIVQSATFRQSSRHDPSAAAKDADDRLLWRFPTRRLDAEVIRDSMIAVSGQSNSRMYGRGFDLFDRRGGLTGFTPVESFSGDGLRRMIYAHKVRRERDGVFGVFDCPDAGQSTARRRESTTPIQALNLLNSRFTLDMSNAFAARVEREAGAEIPRQIDRAYRLALGRAPDAGEVSDAEPVVRAHGLAVLCRALFNSNEALFLP